MSRGAWTGAAARAVLRRPGLWSTAFRQLLRTAPAGWWKRWPPYPRPAEGWIAFRLETQYGAPDAEPSPADLVGWLEWCRSIGRH